MIPPEVWAQLHPVVVVVLAFAAFVIVPAFTAVMSYRAARQSARAVVLSEPTGNGFAKHVKEALARVEAEQQLVRQELLVVRQDVADVREQQTRDRGTIRDLLPGHRPKVGSDV